MPVSFKQSFKKSRAAVHRRKATFLARRPHRSFQRTRRRDYVRSLKLPGYIAFTHYVNKTVWKYRKLLVLMILLYAALTAALIGIGSQQTYGELLSILRETGQDAVGGEADQFGQAALVFVSVATSGLTGNLTEVQQVYAGLLFLLTWLTTVWLLRARLAGHAVKLRDALYNAGGPIVATTLIGFLFIVQLLPIAIATIGYSAASTSGLLDGGVEAMLFWIAAGLLSVLSLYWITATFFALIIVTLPGMYPVRALRTAGDMVVGRRLRLLLRFIWMAVVLSLVWALILIPMILFDGWLKGLIPAIDAAPIIPITLLLLSSVSIVWSACYTYLLYRKVVEDDALPA
jgi:hypothetical protein